VSENLMTKLSLLCSLTGIAALYVGAIQARPSLTPIARINEDYVGLNAVISGQVIDLHEHPDGHLFLKLKDESGGVISVPVFARTRSELGEHIELLDNVQVLGQVELYNGELELVPDRAADIQVVHTPHLELSVIDEGRLGELVKTQGVIVERNIVGSGSLLLTLRENGAQLSVFAPASVVRGDGFPELHVGYTLRVGGLLQEYDEHLELKLGDPAHLEVIEGS